MESTTSGIAFLIYEGGLRTVAAIHCTSGHVADEFTAGAIVGGSKSGAYENFGKIY